MKCCTPLTTDLYPSAKTKQKMLQGPRAQLLSLLTRLPVGFAQLGPRRPSPASCIPESVGMSSEFSHCPQHLFFGSMTSGLSVLLGSGHPEGPQAYIQPFSSSWDRVVSEESSGGCCCPWQQGQPTSLCLILQQVPVQ